MQTLLSKFETRLTREIPSIYTQGRYLELDVTLDSGEVITTRCERPRGSWGAPPITTEEVCTKAQDCLATYLTYDAAEAVIARCLELDSLDGAGVRALLRLASTGT